ncbi:MAG TPA: aromatase/cyclase [Solirubrobacteraceae bacterium]|nr:aromatase/cyclase [Solirubrobacteraceae bacterium]
MESPSNHLEHSIAVSAPPSAAFRVIADAVNWPIVFLPTIHLERDDLGGGEERIHVWALANDEVKAWTSIRNVDPDRLTVQFRQEKSSPPIGAMSGEWIVEAQPDGGSLVRLLHDFSAIDDDPASLQWIADATDRNSQTELATLKAAAEQADERDSLIVWWDDSVPSTGAPDDAWEFMWNAREWPSRVPHVERMSLEEPEPNIQLMEMDTKTKDGSAHTTKSIRVGFPKRRLVYKQTTPPTLLSVHTGHFLIEDAPKGFILTSRHIAMIRPEKIAEVLGADATVQDAREFIQSALTANSRVTMEHASAFAEGAKVG